MTPERWQRLKALFEETLERAPAERAEFVRRACGGDDALRAELESLLAEECAMGDFLKSHAIPSEVSSQAKPPALPAEIGRYRIIAVIGVGGMAVVYKAEQQEPRRIVALKVIKPSLASPEYERRFEREKDALARLQHEGIARIYEAGTADSGSSPQPYFAMELIEQAQPLTEYAESKRLNTRQRLELMAQVCDAVQHAHQNFIIHRDLKPSNILVDEHGQAKVLDFGVARITDSDIGATRQTDVGQIVGTFEYMSPEQARGDPGEVDTRSDIYALGVILYELMADRRPYDLRNKPDLAALHTILKDDAPKLGSINRQCRGDIETIAAKCLEKDKARRYSSAAELAVDLRRYLNNEPIAARPASVGYQLQKFARRNKAVVGGAAAVFAVLVAGIIATSWQARVAAKNATQAEARELLGWANGSLNEDPERSLILGLYSWDKAGTIVGGLEELLHAALSQSRARLSLRGHQRELWCVAWSPDGRKLATASNDGTAKVWDAESGRELLTLRGHQDGVRSIAWSPDGTKIATASYDKTAKLWEAGTGRELLTLRGHQNSVQSIAWSPDGTKIATASYDKTAKLWEAGTGRELLTLVGQPTYGRNFVAWSPNSSKLATANGETAKVWDASTGHELLTLHAGGVWDVAWSPDGSKLATTTSGTTTKVWEASSGRELLSLYGPGGVHRVVAR